MSVSTVETGITAPLFVEKPAEKNDAVLQRRFCRKAFWKQWRCITAPIFVEKLSEQNDAVLQRHFFVEKLSENNDAVLQRHFL